MHLSGKERKNKKKIGNVDEDVCYWGMTSEQQSLQQLRETKEEKEKTASKIA